MARCPVCDKQMYSAQCVARHIHRYHSKMHAHDRAPSSPQGELHDLMIAHGQTTEDDSEMGDDEAEENESADDNDKESVTTADDDTSEETAEEGDDDDGTGSEDDVDDPWEVLLASVVDEWPAKSTTML